MSSSRRRNTERPGVVIASASTRWAGVDVGGRCKGFHVAIVDGRRLLAGPRRLTRPDDVVAWLSTHRPRVVAVDSPRSLAPDGTRSRPDERHFAREVLSLRYTPDRAGLAARPRYYEWIQHGLELYDALRDAGFAAIECFPTAAWTIWAGPRGRASRARWTERALRALRLTGVPARLGQDGRDAIAAALTAFDYDQGRTRSFGDLVVPTTKRRKNRR